MEGKLMRVTPKRGRGSFWSRSVKLGSEVKLTDQRTSRMQSPVGLPSDTAASVQYVKALADSSYIQFTNTIGMKEIQYIKSGDGFQPISIKTEILQWKLYQNPKSKKGRSTEGCLNLLVRLRCGDDKFLCRCGDAGRFFCICSRWELCVVI